MRVTNVLYWVKSLDDSVRFYETLGFSTKTKSPAYAELELGDFGITLAPADDTTEEEFRKDAFAETKGLGAYLFIEVEDVDEYYQQLLGKGLKPVKEPRDWPWGNREFAIKDPDGYRTVFWQSVKER